MADFFPRHSIAWKLEEPPALRRLTLSVVGLGLLTGVVFRLVRAVALAYGPAGNLVFLGLVSVVLALLLCGAAAAHLGNYPISHWAWRVPAFAGLEVAGEMATSLLLIAVRRERIGSGPADWDDWPSMALYALLSRTLTLCIFALILAGVVQFVRSALLRRENRASTVDAIHDRRVG